MNGAGSLAGSHAAGTPQSQRQIVVAPAQRGGAVGSQRAAGTTSRSGTNTAPGSTTPTSQVPTFVASGEVGNDGGTKLGGLLVAGGIVTVVGGLIALRRRKSTQL